MHAWRCSEENRRQRDRCERSAPVGRMNGWQAWRTPSATPAAVGFTRHGSTGALGDERLGGRPSQLEFIVAPFDHPRRCGSAEVVHSSPPLQKTSPSRAACLAASGDIRRVAIAPWTTRQAPMKCLRLRARRASRRIIGSRPRAAGVRRPRRRPGRPASVRRSRAREPVPHSRPDPRRSRGRRAARPGSARSRPG